VIVVTADQRGSRTGHDAVPAVLTTLNSHRRPQGLVRRFERTAGDEVQGVIDAAPLTARLVTDLALTGGWTVGVGVGPVDEPLPRSTRAARGPAFVHARAAVERAHRGRRPLAVEADDPDAASALESAWWLLLFVLQGRSAAGSEAVALADEGLTYAEIGQRLGISASAVGQRLRTAGLVEGRRGLELVTTLVTRADAA
jgi:hypothetical protein